MRTQFENRISNFVPICLMLMTMFILGFGCNTSKPTPDPLIGFHRADEADMDKNKAITDDYKDYIQTLSPIEKQYLGGVLYFEDGTGQHAVRIEVDLNGTAWFHTLLYNKDSRRIKAVKHIGYHYAS